MNARVLWSLLLLLPNIAEAKTNEQLKAKPAKVAWSAGVSMDKAIACLLTDNSFNVQTIRMEGWTDMPMYLQGHRMLLATITPEGEGVRVEARGVLAKAAMRAKPCMGLPKEPGALPMLG